MDGSQVNKNKDNESSQSKGSNLKKFFYSTMGNVHKVVAASIQDVMGYSYTCLELPFSDDKERYLGDSKVLEFLASKPVRRL